MLTNKLKAVFGIALAAIALTYVLVVNAESDDVDAEDKEEISFDTTEDEDSLLSAEVAQEELRNTKRAKAREKRLEQERIQEQKEEEKRQAEEAEAERLAAEALAEQQAEEAEQRKQEELEKEREVVAKEEAAAEALEESTEEPIEKTPVEKTPVEEESAEEVADEELAQEEPKEEVAEEKPVQTSSEVVEPSSGQSLGTFQATAYTAYDGAQVGITAGGTDMAGGNIWTSSGYRIIAADTNVIPMGSIIKITLQSGETIMGQVDDTGGAINGRIIDISFASKGEAHSFGRQSVSVEIVH